MNYYKDKVRIYRTAEETTVRFAEEFFRICRNSPDTITVSLSGGNTPKLLFRILAIDYREKINRKKIKFFWGDERCVPPDHPDSNYGMAKKFLFDKVEIDEKTVFRIRGENDPAMEAARYSKIITENVESASGLPRFDLTILGLGTDGHTASIFPDRIGLFDSHKICETTVHPTTGQNRITITGKVINNSRRIYFLATGESKAEIVYEILNRTGNYLNYPAAKVENPVWFLDKQASMKL